MTMGNPRLYWSTNKTLDLEDLSRYRSRRIAREAVARADSGAAETSILEIYDAADIAVEKFDDSDVWDGLVAWWAWPKQGKSYGFALDSDDTVDTTLAPAASAGATTVTVDDATGITANQRYRLRDTDGLDEEIVTVQSVAGTTITLADGLEYGYNAGAIFRSIDYFPELQSEDREFPVRENQGLTWTLRHRAREYKSA